MFLTKLKTPALVTLTLGIIAGGLAVPFYRDRAVAAPPQAPQTAASARQEAPPDIGKAMAQEQLKVVRQALRDLETLHKADQVSLTDPRFPLWERRQVEAIRAAGAGKSELLAALENYQKRMKEQERLVQQAHANGEATTLDMWETRYRLLEAEMWLSRERAR
jgi:hypothetical protein